MSHEELTDEEMVEFILESLEEDGRVRTDYLDLESVNGRPILAGRVASDEELALIDEILSDVLNIHDYENRVWVDDTLAFEKVPDEEEEEAHGPASLVDDDDDDDEIADEEPYDELNEEEDDKEK